jgi:hypothetical protein
MLPPTPALFSEVEKLVLDYAVGESRTPVDVPDELCAAALKKHFDDRQLVDLTHVIAGENMAGRFNVALGVGAARLQRGLGSARCQPGPPAKKPPPAFRRG